MGWIPKGMRVRIDQIKKNHKLKKDSEAWKIIIQKYEAGQVENKILLDFRKKRGRRTILK